MPSSESGWSGFPPELIHEIVAHCATNVSTLKALCLTSRTARYSAMRYLFSQIVMRSADDFDMWLGIVTRMPILALSVQQVTFSPSASRPRPLQDVWNLSRMPRMPKVLRVKIVAAPCLDYHIGFVAKSPAFLSLFPNVIELHLSAKFRAFYHFYALLGACGQLRTLHLVDTDVVDVIATKLLPDAVESARSRVDLSKLENLLIHSPAAVPNRFIMDLLRSPPAALRSLKLGASSRVLFPPLLDKILELADHSIKHLDVNSNASMRAEADLNNNSQYLQVLRQRSPLLSLASLTIWLDKMVDHDLIDALPFAPNLTHIMLRIAARCSGDIRQPTASLKILATKAEQSFPQLHHLLFQFYVPRALNTEKQDLHCDPDARADFEGTMCLWLPLFEPGVEFRFAWYDRDPNNGTPVKYDGNGFPPWLRRQGNL